MPGCRDILTNVLASPLKEADWRARSIAPIDSCSVMVEEGQPMQLMEVLPSLEGEGEVIDGVDEAENDSSCCVVI